MTYIAQQAPANLDSDGVRRFTEEQLREISRATTDMKTAADETAASVAADVAALEGRVTALESRKNYVLNGAMMVSQENGTTAGTTDGYYAVDGFAVSRNHGGTASAAQVVSVTHGGSPNRFRVTVTVADASVAAGDYMAIYQAIEGLNVADLWMGLASAKTVTLRFGVRAPAGTYGVMLKNAALNRSYTAEYVVAPGEANLDAVKSVSFALDTTGTWLTNNAVGCYLMWSLMCGTTYQQAAGSWAAGNSLGTSNQFNFMGTVGNVFELFDVGMYEGSVVPPFVVPNFATELQTCQRYWEKSSAYDLPPSGGGLTNSEAMFFGGLTAGTHQFGYKVSWKVRKRTAPTVQTYSYSTGVAGRITDAVAAADVVATIDSVGDTGARIYSTGSTSATTIARYFHWTANARM